MKLCTDIRFGDKHLCRDTQYIQNRFDNDRCICFLDKDFVHHKDIFLYSAHCGHSKHCCDTSKSRDGDDPRRMYICRDIPLRICDKDRGMNTFFLHILEYHTCTESVDSRQHQNSDSRSDILNPRTS